MEKTWAVTFYNLETKVVKVDTFGGNTEGEARSDFRDCYRHGVYKILSVVEIPTEATP